MATKKQKISNVPNLRFQGFEEEWVEKKFGEVATNKSEKYNPANAKSSMKCIELEHLTVGSGQLLGYIDGSQSGSIKNVFNKGDLLFGKLRPYLRKYLQAPFDGVCSSEIWVLKGNGISNDFLYRIIQTDKFIDLANQSSGSKMPRADWGVVEKGVFSFPTIAEQLKISKLLSLLDERIATQNKIIENLETLIKGLNEKLLTQKKRFKDKEENDFPDWEENFGNSVFESISNKNHNSDLPILAITQEHGAIPRDMIDYNVSVSDKSIESYKVVQKGDFIISLRSFQGGIEFSNYDGICSPAYVVLRPIKEVNRNFFRLYFKTTGYIKRLTKNLEGIRDGKMISFKYFSEVAILVPSIEEQTKIANFLFSIDRKIETEKESFSTV